MSTLRRFSDKERDYHAYQARQNYLREQNTIQGELEQALKEKAAALQEKDTALQEKDTALQEKDSALAEIKRLKALLADKAQVSPLQSC